jgi:hypothetical protein
LCQYSRRLPPICLTILLAVLVTGCTKDQQQTAYVARVGQSTLTRNDLAVVRDSLWHTPRTVRDYVNEWISSELLYQEAVRRGLAESEELNARVTAIKRRLVIDALLQQTLFGADSADVPEDALRALYASGGATFLLKEDVANVSFALFSDRDPANVFRSRILRGSSWDEALRSAEQDSLLRSQLLQTATRQYFTQTNLYPEELWKLARTLSKDDVSFAVKTDAGYYILMVHTFKRQGEMPDFDYVRGDLRDRLLIEQRRLAFERLVASLRKNTTVELHTELLDSAETRSE